MDTTYLLPANEVTTLEEIRKNHVDYSTRQRASLVLLSLMDRSSLDPGRPFTAIGLKTLIERYRKYGFSCLLPNWDLKYVHAVALSGSCLYI